MKKLGIAITLGVIALVVAVIVVFPVSRGPEGTAPAIEISPGTDSPASTVTPGSPTSAPTTGTSADEQGNSTPTQQADGQSDTVRLRTRTADNHVCEWDDDGWDCDGSSGGGSSGGSASDDDDDDGGDD